MGLVVTLVLEHPTPYRIAFQRITPGLQGETEVVEARERSSARLTRRLEHHRYGALGEKGVVEARWEFQAMLEGLANWELRGSVFRDVAAGEEERTWREALLTVIRGFRDSWSRNTPVREVSRMSLERRVSTSARWNHKPA